jgi:hypothetical protein
LQFVRSCPSSRRSSSPASLSMPPTIRVRFTQNGRLLPACFCSTIRQPPARLFA